MFVVREENGKIKFVSDAPQKDGEWLEDDDPELVAFLNPEPTTLDIIQELESQITDRRKREAILGIQESIDFIQNIEDQIAAERAKL